MVDPPRRHISSDAGIRVSVGDGALPSSLLAVPDSNFDVCLRWARARLRQHGATDLADQLHQQPDWFGGHLLAVRVNLDHVGVHALIRILGDSVPAHTQRWDDDV